MHLGKQILFGGFFLFIPVFYGECVGVTQVIQLGLSLGKTVMSCIADNVYPGEVSGAKQAAVLRFLSHIANGTSHLFDDSRIRDVLSKSLLANAALWHGVKDIQECSLLSKLQKEHGETIPFEVLEKYYHDIQKPFVADLSEFDDGGDCDDCIADDEFFDFCDKRSKTWTESFRTMLRLAEFGFSVGLIFNVGTLKQRRGMAIGQSFCDLLVRYLCKQGSFKSEGIVGKIEATSSFLSPAYDVGKNVCKFIIKNKVFKDGGVYTGINEDCCPICCGEQESKKLIFSCCGYACCSSCKDGFNRVSIEVDGCAIGEGFACPQCRLYYVDSGGDWRRFRGDRKEVEEWVPLVEGEGDQEHIVLDPFEERVDADRKVIIQEGRSVLHFKKFNEQFTFREVFDEDESGK